MIKTIESSDEYEKIKKQEGVLLYFSHKECNVCKVLKPKIHNMLQNYFPQIRMYYVNVREMPEIAGQESVFSVPTITVHFDGREFFRKSRNIGVDEIHSLIKRPYSLMFED
ncbi:MAG: thioredoxin family protein [Bacteroidales bacterium]|nr:thioredoxin family protein [Bacteroidales bacterium]